MKTALIRLNPEIAEKNELADEVIYKLKEILISVNMVGLVYAESDTLVLEQKNRQFLFRLFNELSITKEATK